MQEEWRDVVGFNGAYQVSNQGNVRSFYERSGNTYVVNKNGDGHILKTSPGSKGYLSVRLTKNGKQIHCLVGRLVAQAFIPNHRRLPEVHYLGEDTSCNFVENLYWAPRTKLIPRQETSYDE